MPFDAFQNIILDEPDVEDTPVYQQIKLYRQRRLAAAAFWITIPRDDFDLRTWKCGSKACALGWLGLRGYDGWSLNKFNQPQYDQYSGFTAASVYFGLNAEDAMDCFAAERFIISIVTPVTVSENLLRQRYNVQSK